MVPSVALEITPVAEKGKTDAMLIGLALAFRKLPKPVIGRIHDGKLIFDLRCLTDSEEFERQLTELDIVV
jgi:L-seryl-tRNA(Ser) seleniumtransferase